MNAVESRAVDPVRDGAPSDADHTANDRKGRGRVTPGDGVLPETAVAIVAAAADDRRLFGEMITGLGFETRAFDGIASLDAHESLAGPVIICRRGERSGSDAIEMPARLRGRRIVVCMDSDEESRIVAALDAGAHHVFRLDESPALSKARMEAALRRHSHERRRVLAVAPFMFDLERRTVSIDDCSLELSPKEFDLAYYLFEHRCRIVTNAELLTSVWSLPHDIHSRRIDTAACRVRTKMRLGEETGWVLRRFRREGYGLYVDTRRSPAQAPTRTPVAALADRRDVLVDLPD